ncbi:transcriptional regulator, AraC family [Pseudopedobacter saltans DSM 12145]|uniref:Transcriptional regulator, AraC family n=1 Tax=Pseudopedobacter saltans (strain ATCC 51119 / DSM 12145 / JCM 21818 / CCUG 39354 / LMG 10337 / NBRC 100064 / NCIMB 13643) TaxID=762903 RepID=F0SC86_PSESL|nr:AraC family transcriptional regulator [Pseudopedobacter saltans]ADY51683.1 transcriptional regulator, AraC family [Pseudopedobacter saltans DSM 12145]
MRPHLLKIPLNPEHSFNVRYDIVSHFYKMWHFHHEIELVYIIKGSGLQFTGDHIHPFKPGDLIMFGSQLPHLWRSDEIYLQPNASEKLEAIVLHFSPDCFGRDFFSLAENKQIAKLLDTAKKGIRVNGKSKESIAAIMHQLLGSEGSRRIILLLQILEVLSISAELEIVNQQSNIEFNSATEIDRLNNVYQFLLDNYTREIELKEIAEIANITPHAFCRYFKSRTRKTFSGFLIELRINHAAKLLIESNKSVSEICYESGFNNFSHFNKSFKSIIGRTPLQHRKSMLNLT